LSRVNTEIGDRLQAYHLRIRSSHPNQLSLAITLWVEKMRTILATTIEINGEFGVTVRGAGKKF